MILISLGKEIDLSILFCIDQSMSTENRGIFYILCDEEECRVLRFDWTKEQRVGRWSITSVTYVDRLLV